MLDTLVGLALTAQGIRLDWSWAHHYDRVH